MAEDPRIKVEDIVRIVLDLPDGEDVSQLARSATPKWDSLAQVTLIAALEDEFAIAFDLADFAAMTSVAGLVAAVAARQR